MITFLELSEQPLAIAAPEQLPTRSVKVFRLERGADVFALLADDQCKPLGILAAGVTPGLARLIDEIQFLDRASGSDIMADLLDVGFCMLTHSAAAWISREARLIMDLRPMVRKALEGESLAKGA